MQIILKEDIIGLGYKNDIVDVKSGYGRNYLIPQGKAVIASPSAKKILAENLKQQAHKLAAILEAAKKEAEALNGVTVTIASKVSATGVLYGSVNAAQVAAELANKGIAVDRKRIVMKDIKTVFQYHGAEHKTIHCFENNLELTPENAQTFYTLHPRCGTSFLFFVMIVAVFVHAFLGWPNVWLRVITRILVLPVIAGLSYELLKWAGRSDNWVVKILSLPGIYLQKLTTKEPTLQQLEVAIAAVKAVLNDGDDVPYFEGICDLEGREVKESTNESAH